MISSLQDAIRRRHVIWRTLDSAEVEEVLRLARGGAVVSPMRRRYLQAFALMTTCILVGVGLSEIVPQHRGAILMVGLMAGTAMQTIWQFRPVQVRFDLMVPAGSPPPSMLRDFWRAGIRGGELVRAQAAEQCRRLLPRAICLVAAIGVLFVVDALCWGLGDRPGRAVVYAIAMMALAAGARRSVVHGELLGHWSLYLIVSSWRFGVGGMHDARAEESRRVVRILLRGLVAGVAVVAVFVASGRDHWEIAASAVLASATLWSIFRAAPEPGEALRQFEVLCAEADEAFEQMMLAAEERER